MSRFFGNAIHTGYVVPNIDVAIGRMLASGIGPFFVMRGIRPPARFRGRRHDPLITAAFAYTGNVQYEFVAQHDATPSAYLEYLARNPAGGLHHVAYFCTTFDDARSSARHGNTEFDVVQEFITPDGHAYEMYAEPQGVDNPLLIQWMIPSPLGKFFEDMEAIAQTWNGEAPIRDALALLPPEMRPSTEPV